MDSKLTYRRLVAVRIMAPIACMALLWVVSSVPEGNDNTLGGIWLPPLVQNSLHIPAFGVLAATWLWALDFGSSATNPALLAWVLTTAYGVVDEVHQAYVPGRTSSLEDVLLDAVGACLTVVLAYVIVWRVKASVGRLGEGRT